MIASLGRQASAVDSDPAADLVGLMEQVVARNQAALGTLYDLTVNRAFAVAMRVLGNNADAEEAVCAAYQQLWEQANHYSVARGSVMGWLSTMVWTRSVDLARRRRAHVSIDDLHPIHSASAYAKCEDDAASLLDAFATGSAVRRALSQLKPVTQRLLKLAFVGGLSHPEIAQQTKLPLGTVKSHIRRGLVELRRMLQSLEFRDG